jgi:diguanylate cyclase (GGDEF)-like protein/PAS domain S-box-containing protein
VASASHAVGAPASALFSCSLSGTVLAAGAALGRLSGRPLADAPGAPAHALVHPSSHEHLRLALRAASDGTASGSMNLCLLHADGFPVQVRTSWSVLAGAGADATHLVFVCADPPAGPGGEHQVRDPEAFDGLSRDVAVVGDARGTLLYASPAVVVLFGYEADDVVASDLWSFLHPDDLPAARAGYRSVVDGDGPRTTVLRVRAARGDWRWVKVVAVNQLDDPVGGVVCAVHDITADVDAEQALRTSEAGFRTVADTSEEGIWVVGTTAETLYANSRMAAILGVPLDPPCFRDLVAALSPDAVGVDGPAPTGFEGRRERFEIAYAHPDGLERRLWVATAPLSAADGTPEGTVAMVSDITDVRRTEQQLRAAALCDSLTQLPNRTLLLDRLTQALARAEDSTAVLLVDLDHFRMVNDSRGHGIGDQLLVGVGARLVAAVSGRATVARFGGDEFVVVSEDTDERRARTVARELLDALAEPFPIGGAAVHVAASIGVAVAGADAARDPGAAAMDLLRHADTAVHAAKSAGRGRVHVFDRTLGEDVEHRYALAAELRAALADDALDLEYQPIVDLRTGAVVGLEALARWTHPERGAVPPTSFVAVAELTGLAPQLDRWVVQRALHDMAALRTAGVVPDEAYVAVNLSACNLTDSFVFDDLLTWAGESGMPPAQVVIEITETAIMQDTDVAVRLLRRLREQGFRVAMDDFGTGYSSLAYLRDLPISALKIDRSFVADITEQQGALAIVASIVDLARAVGVAVVAEGVETAEQAALLGRLGCLTAQGWLWSPAVPVTALLGGRAWGSPLPLGSGPTAPARVRRRRRDAGVAEGLQRLLELHQDGVSVATIAASLNAEGFRTASGLRWHRSSVNRVIAHHIRRSTGTPEAGTSARRPAWRPETGSLPGPRPLRAVGEPDADRTDGVENAG